VDVSPADVALLISGVGLLSAVPHSFVERPALAEASMTAAWPGSVSHIGQRLECGACNPNVVVLDPGCTTELPECGGSPMRPAVLIPCSEPYRAELDSKQTTAGSVYSDVVKSRPASVERFWEREIQCREILGD
jgi:hypothetical protein